MRLRRMVIALGTTMVIATAGCSSERRVVEASASNDSVVAPAPGSTESAAAAPHGFTFGASPDSTLPSEAAALAKIGADVVPPEPPAGKLSLEIGFVPEGLQLVHTSESTGINGEPMATWLYSPEPPGSKEPHARPTLVISMMVANDRTAGTEAQAGGITNVRQLDDATLGPVAVCDLDAGQWTGIRWQPYRGVFVGVSALKRTEVDGLLEIAHKTSVAVAKP